MRALIVGINKYQSISHLYGCLDDVVTVKDTLINMAGLNATDIVTLEDEQATAQNIRQRLTELGASAIAGERLYFHYSGHGAQLETSNPNEPDGVDEVLCPHDFRWSADTAITDDELINLTSAIPATSDLIVTLDCCYSGDYSRAAPRFTARTPRTVPSAVEDAVLRARRNGQRRSLRSIGLASNCIVVSACLPFQEAIEINGPNGPAGAFSTYFFGRVGTSPQLSVRSVVEAISPTLAPLGKTGMTPVIEGADRLRDEPYYDSAPVTRSPVPVRRNVLRSRSGQLLWAEAWGFEVAGSEGKLGARLNLTDGNFWLEVHASMFGVTPTISVPLGGGVEESIPIAFGFSLTVGVSGFMFTQEQLSFQLRIGVRTPLPFVPPITVVDSPITIPLSNITRGSAMPIATLADLAAFKALQSSGRGRNVPRDVIFKPSAPNSSGDGRDASRGGALLQVVLGPSDDEGYLYIDGNNVLTTRYSEQKQYRGRLGDGIHTIRTTVRNSGLWAWRATVRVYVNDELVGNQDQSGGSGFYGGYINEAERNWDLYIENGQLMNFSGG